MPEYIIILHRYTINDNHMMYGSWNMGHDRQIFLLFWTILWFSIPLTIQKIQILKTLKNTWRYYHSTYVCHKWQSYDVWFLKYGVWWAEFFVILNHFLPFYSANNLENSNFEKWREKNAWRYYHILYILFT